MAGQKHQKPVKFNKLLIITAALAAGLAAASCAVDQDMFPATDNTGDDTEEQVGSGTDTETVSEAGAVIPEGMASLARVYIDTPYGSGITSKSEWVRFCNIRITGDADTLLFAQDSLKIRGRGNSTWRDYEKKSYYFKLNRKADLLGTGKSRKWVLLANWMDRTLLRNDVAFEAARRTSLEWTPSGTFVELYLNGEHQGNYWLGEKINVEGSKFTADYLFSLDTSDSSEWDYSISCGYRPNSRKTGLPVEVKYPDRDDFEAAQWSSLLSDSKKLLESIGKACYTSDYASVIDVDSFCDWILVHELCYNLEPNHPKSCFFHVRDGKMYAGPVWDFDWATFTPDRDYLELGGCLWFDEDHGGLYGDAAFVKRLKERWAALKPQFESLGSYIDARAEMIRESESVNHDMWPCYPNPLSEDYSGMVNHDERMNFTQAVNRMKSALTARIVSMDGEIAAL